MSRWGSLFVMFMLILISDGFAVCLEDLEAQTYQCERLPTADAWCSKKHGAEFKAYYTTNTCNKQSAAESRGEDTSNFQEDDGGVFPAVCLSHEQGEKLNCEYYDYIKAERYCHQKYGLRFIAFMEQGQCTQKKAAALRGEVDAKNLVKGIKLQIEEISNGLTYLDKDQLKGMGHFSNSKPTLGANFYTSSMKAIMAKLNMLRDSLYKNSKLKVEFPNKYSLKFIKYSLSYLTLLSRVYKLYAHVAHRNHFALKTYDFKTLEYLNLKLQKDYGLELMAKASFMAKTIDDGAGLEFYVSEQDKQGFEYAAVQNPKDKEDFAKYLTFVGSREFLTNTWALDRMNRTDLNSEEIRSCGKGFLSIRPDTKNDIKKSKAYQELLTTDAFFDQYVANSDKLKNVTQEYPLLTDSSSKTLVKYIYSAVPEIQKLIKDSDPSISYNIMAESYASEDAPYIVMAEIEDWMSFSNQFFKSIVMPLDGILSRNKIKKRIVTEVYKRRVGAISETLVSSYVWISDASIKLIEEKVKEYLDKNIKADWEQRLSLGLTNVLRNYNNKTKTADTRKKSYLDRHVKIMEEFGHAARVKVSLKSAKRIPKGLKLLQPLDITQLMTFFENYLIYKDVRLQETLMHSDRAKSIYDNFQKRLNERFADKIFPYIKNMKLTASHEKRALVLRESANEVAAELRKEYNVKPKDYIAIDDVTVKRDNTNVNKTYYLRQKSPNNDTSSEVSKNDLADLLALQKRDFADEKERPYFVNDKGEVFTKNRSQITRSNYNLNIFKSILSIDKKSTDKVENILPNFRNYAKKSGSMISSDKDIVIAILGAFNLKSEPILKKLDIFARGIESQRVLADQLTEQATEFGAILRREKSHTTKTSGYRGTVGGAARTTVSQTSEYSLFEYIGKFAVNDSGLVNKKKVREIINAELKLSNENIKGKLLAFCSANYLNYKNDDDFKNIFHSSGYLREMIKYSDTSDPKYTARLTNMDEEIRKEVRTGWESAQEDYLEPVATFTGIIALSAVAILAIISTAGVATPGLFGLGMSGLSGFIALEFWLAFPIIASGTITRLNQNFFVTPHNLRAQESIANSMIDQSQMSSWNYIKGMKKNNNTQKMITVALLPLDLLYGKAIVSSTRKSLGISGVKAARKLLNLELRMWSAPPKSLLTNASYKEFRKAHGIRKSLILSLKGKTHNAKLRLPRYQPLSKTTINVGILRKGLSNKAANIGISKTPWDLSKDIDNYAKQLKSKINEYERFIADEAKLVKHYRLKGDLPNDMALKHGLKYSAVTYIPKQLYTAMKNKKLGNFFKNYGEVWEKLKQLQGKLVHERYETLDSILKKLDAIKKDSAMGSIKSVKGKHDTFFEKFLSELSHEEVSALQFVAKKAKGKAAELKQVFKLHNKVLSGLNPYEYNFGNVGAKFKTVYPQDLFLGESLNGHYAFKSPSEDIVNFYESMMKQNIYKGSEESLLRREIEEMLSDMFTISSKGSRIFKD